MRNHLWSNSSFFPSKKEKQDAKNLPFVIPYSYTGTENQLTTETLTDVFRTHFQNHGMGEFGYTLGARVKIEYTGSSLIGESGLDDTVSEWFFVDPVNNITIGYLQYVLGYGSVYAVIHSGIRERVYLVLEDSIKKS